MMTVEEAVTAMLWAEYYLKYYRVKHTNQTDGLLIRFMEEAPEFLRKAMEKCQ